MDSHQLIIICFQKILNTLFTPCSFPLIFSFWLYLKGTLLNRLFGTNFDVMDEEQRHQTTKGIWMSQAVGLNLLVMDVEGTDGRERGEDQVGCFFCFFCFQFCS